MADYLFPQQVVLELGGAAKLVHQVRMLEEATPGSVVAKIDIANAFNEIMRAAVIAHFGTVPTLAHMQLFLYKLLNPECALVLDGEVWIDTASGLLVTSAEGLVQGCPFSSAVFAVALQPHLVALDAKLEAAGGAARAGADDVYAVGPPLGRRWWCLMVSRSLLCGWRPL